MVDGTNDWEEGTSLPTRNSKRSFSSCISCSYMEFRWFVFNPFNKLLYVLIFQDSLNCMIMIEQFSLSKVCMYLSMADSVKKNNILAFKRLGD